MPPKGKLWFNSWLDVAPDLEPFAASIIADLERARRVPVYPQHRAGFEATVRAVVANLIISALEAKSGRITVSLTKQAWQSNRRRYERGDITPEMLRSALESGKAARIIELVIGQRGRTSTIRPTAQFVAALPSAAHSEGATEEVKGQELIILNCKRQQDGNDIEIGRKPTPLKERAAYDDTPDTNVMRDAMRAINASFADADIAFVPDGGSFVNTRNRTLRRYFVVHDDDAPRFDQGGRLFGAFWTNLARERRRAALRIDGERAAEVDYSALFLRLAYALHGEQLDDNDPYQFTPRAPGWQRAIIKLTINAQFFADGVLKRLPDDVLKIATANNAPTEWRSAAKVTARILAHLPDLREHFGSRIGYSFMRTESNIMVKALQRFASMGVTALPLHDAVLVARSHADKAKDVLEEIAAKATGGIRIPCSIK